MNKPYEIKQGGCDLSRPWIVVATFRSFNRVIANYSEKADAQRRARDLNRKAAPSTWAAATRRAMHG